MSPEKLPPLSGFLNPEFWTSLVTVVSTFLLSEWGISSSFLQSLPGGSSWLPIALTIGIGLYIVIKTIMQSRRSDQDLPSSNFIEPKSHGPFESSEFWLGLTAIAFKLLQDSHIAGTKVDTSVTTMFLILAIVYALSRSQLKQAYMASLLRRFLKTKNPVTFKGYDGAERA
ncbi:MAG: hypothetical protein H0X24_03370 [Ktedonobacterales bacterium]|nr:hypothetical protein [Ktedonobacterales bacterium]